MGDSDSLADAASEIENALQDMSAFLSEAGGTLPDQEQEYQHQYEGQTKAFTEAEVKNKVGSPPTPSASGESCDLKNKSSPRLQFLDETINSNEDAQVEVGDELEGDFGSTSHGHERNQNRSFLNDSASIFNSSALQNNSFLESLLIDQAESRRREQLMAMKRKSSSPVRKLSHDLEYSELSTSMNKSNFNPSFSHPEKEATYENLSGHNSSLSLSNSSQGNDGDTSPNKYTSEEEMKMLTASEIIAAVRYAIVRTHSRLYDAFVVMDKKGKGYLTREELHLNMKNLNLAVRNEDIERFCDSVDANRDGNITFQEFWEVFETEYENKSKQTWNPRPRTKYSPSKDSFISTSTTQAYSHSSSELPSQSRPEPEILHELTNIKKCDEPDYPGSLDISDKNRPGSSHAPLTHENDNLVASDLEQNQQKVSHQPAEVHVQTQEQNHTDITDKAAPHNRKKRNSLTRVLKSLRFNLSPGRRDNTKSQPNQQADLETESSAQECNSKESTTRESNAIETLSRDLTLDEEQMKANITKTKPTFNNDVSREDKEMSNVIPADDMAENDKFNVDKRKTYNLVDGPIEVVARDIQAHDLSLEDENQSSSAVGEDIKHTTEVKRDLNLTHSNERAVFGFGKNDDLENDKECETEKDHNAYFFDKVDNHYDHADFAGESNYLFEEARMKNEENKTNLSKTLEAESRVDETVTKIEENKTEIDENPKVETNVDETVTKGEEMQSRIDENLETENNTYDTTYKNKEHIRKIDGYIEAEIGVDETAAENEVNQRKADKYLKAENDIGNTSTMNQESNTNNDDTIGAQNNHDDDTATENEENKWMVDETLVAKSNSDNNFVHNEEYKRKFDEYLEAERCADESTTKDEVNVEKFSDNIEEKTIIDHANTENEENKKMVDEYLEVENSSGTESFKMLSESEYDFGSEVHERSPIVPDSEELMDGDDCFENKEKVPDHIVNNCSDRVNKEPVIDDGKAIRDSQDQDITKLKASMEVNKGDEIVSEGDEDGEGDTEVDKEEEYLLEEDLKVEGDEGGKGDTEVNKEEENLLEEDLKVEGLERFLFSNSDEEEDSDGVEQEQCTNLCSSPESSQALSPSLEDNEVEALVVLTENAVLSEKKEREKRMDVESKYADLLSKHEMDNVGLDAAMNHIDTLEEKYRNEQEKLKDSLAARELLQEQISQLKSNMRILEEENQKMATHVTTSTTEGKIEISDKSEHELRIATIAEFKEKIFSLQSEREDLREHVQQLLLENKSVNLLENQLNKLKSELEVERKMNTEYKEAGEKYHDDISRKSSAIEEYKETISDLQTQKDDLHDEIQRIYSEHKIKLKSDALRVDQLKLELEAEQEKLSVLELQKDSHMRLITVHENESKEFSERLEKLKVELETEKEAKNNYLLELGKLDDLQYTINELQKEKKDLHDQVKRLMSNDANESRLLTSDVENKVQQINKLKEHISRLEAEGKDARDEMDGFKHRTFEDNRKIKSLSEQINTLNSELTLEKKLNAEYAKASKNLDSKNVNKIDYDLKVATIEEFKKKIIALQTENGKICENMRQLELENKSSEHAHKAVVDKLTSELEAEKKLKSEYIQASQNYKEDLRTQVKHLKTEVEQLSQVDCEECKRYQARFVEHDSSLARLKLKNEVLLEENNELNTRIQQSHLSSSSSCKNCQVLKSQFDDIVRTLESLKIKNESLSKENKRKTKEIEFNSETTKNTKQLVMDLEAQLSKQQDVLNEKTEALASSIRDQSQYIKRQKQLETSLSHTLSCLETLTESESAKSEELTRTNKTVEELQISNQQLRNLLKAEKEDKHRNGEEHVCRINELAEKVESLQLERTIMKRSIDKTVHEKAQIEIGMLKRKLKEESIQQVKALMQGSKGKIMKMTDDEKEEAEIKHKLQTENRELSRYVSSLQSNLDDLVCEVKLLRDERRNTLQHQHSNAKQINAIRIERDSLRRELDIQQRLQSTSADSKIESGNTSINQFQKLAWKTTRDGLRRMKEDLNGIKDPLRLFLLSFELTIRKLENHTRRYKEHKSHLNNVKSGMSSDVSINELNQVSQMKDSVSMERLRRRRLRSKFFGFAPKAICTVFKKKSLSTANEEVRGGLCVEAIPDTNQIAVHSSKSKRSPRNMGGESSSSARCFGFDDVFVEEELENQMVGNEEIGKAACAGEYSYEGEKSQADSSLAVIIDSILDGDNAVVFSSGPNTGTTTSKVISLLFDVVNANGGSQGSDDLFNVSMACVDVCNDRVYDMLVCPKSFSSKPGESTEKRYFSGHNNNNNNENSDSGVETDSASASDYVDEYNSKGLFEPVPISKHDARSFGRIDIEKYGVTVVQVTSKREASLVAAMGAGNRVAASVTRNENLDSLSKSHFSKHDADSCADKPVSHLIFTIWVSGKDPVSGKSWKGKLNIVELASIHAISEAEKPHLRYETNDPKQMDLTSDSGSLNSGTGISISSNKAATRYLCSSIDELVELISGKQWPSIDSDTMKLFRRSVFLAMLRDCIVSENSVSTNNRHLNMADDSLESTSELTKRCYILVHVSFHSNFGRWKGDLMTALQFAPRIRTENQLLGPMLASSAPNKSSGARELNARKKKSTNRAKRRKSPGDSSAGNSQKDGIKARSRVIKVLMSHTEGMLHSLFLSWDTENRGYLSKSLFKRGLLKIDPKLAKHDVEIFTNGIADENQRITFREFFRVLGDAKAGNQHSVFVKDRDARKIAFRERRKIKKHLSPNFAS